jgi:hypothetical protein
VATERAPKGLGPPGRALWRGLTADFTLNPVERELLGQACQTADLIAALTAELGADLVVAGSRNQPVVNALLRELREQRMVLRRLLASLKVPAAETERVSGASLRASDAARRRWRMEKWRESGHGA